MRRNRQANCWSRTEKIGLRLTLGPIFFTSFLLTGCAGDQVMPPHLAIALSTQYAHENGGSVETGDNWWDKYQDPELARLIGQSLAANQDVLVAVNRLDEAKAQLGAQTSRLLPSVALGASALRSSSGLPARVKQGMPDTRATQIDGSLSWEIDISGRIQSARAAAKADLVSTQSEIAGVQLMVAGEVARAYFTLRSASQRVALLESLLQAQRDYLDLIRQRHAEGFTDALILARVSASVAESEAQLPELRKVIGVTEHQLARLTGANPSVPPTQSVDNYPWPIVAPIHAGQPSDLLRRRPDLIAAEAQYVAQSYRENESRALQWPQIFVSALLGRENLTLNAIPYSPARFSNVAAAFAIPLLNRGQIDANIATQSARTHEALLQWQKSCLVAIEEVENSLLAQAEQAQILAQLTVAVTAQKKVLDLSESLYREGQIDRLALLGAKQALLGEQMTLSSIELQTTLIDVQLIKALGGGWKADRSADIALQNSQPKPEQSDTGAKP